MDPNTQRLISGAAGAGGGAEKLYVEDVFSTHLYTGNGSTQTITNGIDLSGKGGLVWIKQRSLANTHRLFDTLRGVEIALSTAATTANNTRTGSLTAFNSDGFDLGNDTTTNGSGQTHASWTFRKAAKFFDVVTWTGNGSASQTINHNLGSTPGCIIIKATSTTSEWFVWHRNTSAAGVQQYESGALLNSTAAQQALYLFSSTPTATSFTVRFDSNYTSLTANGVTFVAYLFAHDAGGFGDTGNDSVVSCGSYTGNGGSQIINLGWEPQWVLIKRADSTGDWLIFDNMRGMSGPGAGDQRALRPNLSNAETPFSKIYAASTGFGFESEGGISVNASGGTYIYIAIRRGPMKTPTDATTVFAAQATRAASNGTTSANMFTSNFPIDMYIQGSRGGVNSSQVIDRVRGGSIYFAGTANNNAEFTGYNARFDDMDGVSATTTGGATSDFCGWMFRRAPGFFDVVAYTGTGTGSARTVSHNLGVAPELMIVKQRNASALWLVYAAPVTATNVLFLSETDPAGAVSSVWNDTSPTSSVFTVGPNSLVNASSGTYIAYLFASCSGVSKVGSYTGTGTTLNIDCGFTNGARFVLIKRTDSTGDWFVYDTARGIVSGNDPYLLLNSTAAEVTNTDYIDPLNAGFQISSTAPAAINANGGSFIYLAIA